MLADLFLIAVIGGLLELDRTSAVQGFFSEPIVAAPIVGWAMGDFMLGVKIGILLELFFLGGISIGGSSPLDGTLSAVVTSASAATVTAFLEKETLSESALIAASVFLLMIPASRLGKVVDDWIKEMNVEAAHEVDCSIKDKGIIAVEKAVYQRVLVSFLIWSATVLVSAVAGIALLWGTAVLMPQWVQNGLDKVNEVLPFIAGCIALSALRIKRVNWWFAGMCLGLFLISAGFSGVGK